jgi:hypothetical protein
LCYLSTVVQSCVCLKGWRVNEPGRDHES